MNNSKKYLFLIVMILLVVIGVSLAYFGITIIGNDTAKGNNVVTGNLELTYTDTNEITLDNAFPGDSFEKTISVKNTGTKEVSYNLVWTELTNEITNNELVIEATCKRLNSSGVEEGTCNSISQTPISDTTIKKNISIEPNVTHEYNITITFIDTGKSQNYNKNKTFEGKLGINESAVKTVYCTFDGELTQGAEYVNGQYTYRYMQEVTPKYDSDSKKEVMTWTDMSSDGWGVGLTDRTSTEPVISNLCTYINNKPVVSMKYMFYNSQATSLAISGFNTSNVINMANMFTGTKTTTLDVSNFDTSNVTNMNAMFGDSANLKTIYVNKDFNVDKVTSANGVFDGCTSLVGGAGTKYSSVAGVGSGSTSERLAKIDGGTSNPGFFTKKPTKPNSFATDSWDTIVYAVRTNNLSKYKVGDTKDIDLGTTYGTHPVRIANMSIPSECSTSGFSQSACGFVVEFADNITTHNMNPGGTYNGTQYDFGWNKDGWPASSMHTFVNNDIYNSLPSDLKNIIIDTTTVSGYGSEDAENFTSTDKLYLLAPGEVWSDWKTSSGASYDSAKDLTRTLDYYTAQGVTTSSYSGAIKKNGTSAIYWWLRSARSSNYRSFYDVRDSGGWCDDFASYAGGGVSPAFRIG